MMRMNFCLRRAFPFSGILVLLVMGLALAPAVAYHHEDELMEATAEALENGVPEDVVDLAIEQGQAAGLNEDDIADLLDELEDIFEDDPGFYPGDTISMFIENILADMDDDDMDDMDDDGDGDDYDGDDDDDDDSDDDDDDDDGDDDDEGDDDDDGDDDDGEDD